MPSPALKRLLPALLAALALGACAAGDGGETTGPPRGEGYDFHVLSLSWSPSYCLAEGPSANRLQCGAGRGFGFVVHGLWPQFESGWPEFCDSPHPAFVPKHVVESMADIMPSAGLVGHQWRKHGTCTGLSQEDYFRLTRAAFERVELPDRFRQPAEAVEIAPAEVEAAFLAANDGMRRDGIAVTCDEERLREVRICLDHALAFRACEEVDRRSCRRASVALPPAAR